MPGKKVVSNKITIIVIAVMAILAFGIKRCKNSTQYNSERQVTTEVGDWRHHKLIYTKHARCRMDCRNITEAEVENVLATGLINEGKSEEENDEAEGHCPSYALEGDTKDGQHLRVVFGACDKITKVITAIDLGKEYECNCR
jgi:hypothetical protein